MKIVYFRREFALNFFAYLVGTVTLITILDHWLFQMVLVFYVVVISAIFLNIAREFTAQQKDAAVDE